MGTRNQVDDKIALGLGGGFLCIDTASLLN